MLKLFVIRLACVNTDHAATILRPILNHIREDSSRTASEKEALQASSTDPVRQAMVGLKTCILICGYLLFSLFLAPVEYHQASLLTLCTK